VKHQVLEWTWQGRQEIFNILWCRPFLHAIQNGRIRFSKFAKGCLGQNFPNHDIFLCLGIVFPNQHGNLLFFLLQVSSNNSDKIQPRSIETINQLLFKSYDQNYSDLATVFVSLSYRCRRFPRSDHCVVTLLRSANDRFKVLVFN
jgi:hypothetical protein